MELSGGALTSKVSIEIIDELLPLFDEGVSLSIPEKVEIIKCVPDGNELEFQKKRTVAGNLLSPRFYVIR